MEHVLHPCARQRLPSHKSPAAQSHRTVPREDPRDAGKVLELLIPGEAPESVAHPGRGPRICASTINIIQRHSGLTGSQLKPMCLCYRIAPKRSGSHADRTRVARGSHQTGSLKSRCFHCTVGFFGFCSQHISVWFWCCAHCVVCLSSFSTARPQLLLQLVTLLVNEVHDSGWQFAAKAGDVIVVIGVLACCFQPCSKSVLTFLPLLGWSGKRQAAAQPRHSSLMQHEILNVTWLTRSICPHKLSLIHI